MVHKSDRVNLWNNSTLWYRYRYSRIDTSICRAIDRQICRESRGRGLWHTGPMKVSCIPRPPAKVYGIIVGTVKCKESMHELRALRLCLWSIIRLWSKQSNRHHDSTTSTTQSIVGCINKFLDTISEYNLWSIQK